MPNTYFQFKQFIIHQDHCAMKVCTDACLFGAWVAGKVSSVQMTVDRNHLRALDIGTGTGLLSLMLAQKTTYWIDAVEIDTTAAQQAMENAKASAWNDRIEVHQSNIIDWTSESYDLIISNPPFFENDLKSADDNRNLALHDAGLTLDTLFQEVKRLLGPNGSFAVLLPAHRLTAALQLGKQYGFSAIETVKVSQTEKHTPFRVMLWLERGETVGEEYSLLIKENGVYSAGFVALLRDYYLQL